MPTRGTTPAHRPAAGQPPAAELTALPHVLREYALLADGERGVLVGPRGDFVWMCFPAWDSGAVFSSLIGGPGVYAVTPTGRFVWGGYYEPASLIWRSRWVSDAGIVECREALAHPGEADRAVLLRQVTAVTGSHRLEVLLDLRHDFGAEPLRAVHFEGGTWTARSGDVHVRWTGAATARVERQGGGSWLRCDLMLEPGQRHDLVLELAQHPLGEEPPPAERLWDATSGSWARSIPDLGRTVAPRDAAHAYAVLAGLSSTAGGTVAAATTSLPERADTNRSYDYRYVWCRDQAYIGAAVAAAGPHPLMDTAVNFLRDRLLADGPHLNPAYTTRGSRVPSPRSLDLPGYPGGTDTIGNHVNEQFQLDIFGEALLLFAAADRHGHLDQEGWRAAEVAAAAIAKRWREADAGVWETEPREWTHSRLICAAGLRAVSERGPGGSLAAVWMALADAIVADCAARAVHPSGRWQRAVDDPRLDASLLLPALRGAVPAADARSQATLAAVVQDLTQEGYVYRYRPDQRPLGDAEGAFLLCGFWMALAHQQQGNSLDAARWFERNRAACGPPGLCSEEFDVRQRQMRGNLPQAFVHALLLESAARLWEPAPPPVSR